MDPLRLFVSVPVAGFRVAQAREFWETYPCPPPSTVYGMLLSLVGETNRLEYQGSELATALLSVPCHSVVLRTLWRIKNRKSGPGLGNNARPDFQELLSHVLVSVWVRKGEVEVTEKPLVRQVASALDNFSTVRRFGGLALGESTHLVDEVRLWRSEDPEQGRLLVRDEQGELCLPVWPDHVGSKGTRWGQFRLLGMASLDDEPPDEAWIPICPPEDDK